MRINPVAGAVAVELAPVVVPGFGAVEGFGDVVVALTVASEVEKLVGCIFRCFRIKFVQVSDEEVPCCNEAEV